VRRLGLVLVLVVAAGCRQGAGQAESPSPVPSPTAVVTPGSTPQSIDQHLVLTFGSHQVTAEVADEPLEHRTGLMYREELGADRGMLFLFPAARSGGFWMKNTLIPLSIAFLEPSRQGFRVVDILDMEPCRTDDCPTYRPKATYQAALEVNKGWFEDAGVEVGDTAEVAQP
jgi:uncharacterized membrane protein (UPF0127 family)